MKIRPVGCTHSLWPVCGCVEPPTLATNLIVERDKQRAAMVQEVKNKPKKAGRPKSPWAIPAPEEDPSDAFMNKLPQILEDPYARQNLLRLVDAQLARADFAEFCRQAWHVVEPTTKLEWNWHHELICKVVQGLFEDWEHGQDDETFKQRITQCVLNVPPGSLKSRLLAVFFPTWAWIRRPGWRCICLSVNEDAAMRDARDSRNLIKSEWFQSSFTPDWSIKLDQDAISNYGNTKGGVRLSRASGSEIVGLRGDCFQKSTLVATETGPVTIGDLHEMVPGTWPRVWAMDHQTGKAELRSIEATRHVGKRPTVVVRTNTNMLQCTREHNIWTEEGYTEAAHVTGRAVSVLQQSELSLTREAGTMQELHLGNTTLLSMPTTISTSGSRAGEVKEAVRLQPEANLFKEVFGQGEADSRCEPRTSNPLPGLQEGFQTTFYEDHTANVLPGVLLGIAPEAADSGATRLPGVSDRVPAEVHSISVLQSEVCKQGALGTYEGQREFALQSRSELQRNPLAPAIRADSRAGRFPMHSMCLDGEQSRYACTSRGLESSSQLSRESNHTLRQLPHHSPQIQKSTVLSVSSPSEFGSEETVDVYDIQVEGLHNFFAAGILGTDYINVSNCLIVDDANNPKEAESKLVREHVNELYTVNIHNRVNHPEKSLRIGIQQRTHAEDWTGYIIKHYGQWTEEDPNPHKWLHVVIPAEFEPERRATTPWGNDPRTEKGESLHPVRMSPALIAATRLQFGTQKYAGQYQQRPTLAEGGTVKMKWWRFFHYEGEGPLPQSDRKLGDEVDRLHPSKKVGKTHGYNSRWDFDWTVISLDPAAKRTERGSQHGILVIAGKGPQRFILDDKTMRGDILDVLAIVEKLCRQYDPDRILIEAKAAGPALTTLFEDRFQRGKILGSNGRPLSVVVDSIEPQGGKEQRIDSCLPELEAGLVYLHDGADWLEPFVGEVCGYPNSSFDDRPDALSQSLNHMRTFMSYQLPDW